AISITINGGEVDVVSTQNDAIDSNGTLTINGGIIYATGGSGAETAFDSDMYPFTVNAGYKHGIYSDDYIKINAGNINVNVSARDGVRSINGFIMNDGNLTIRGTGANIDEESKGIKVDGEESTKYAGEGFIVNLYRAEAETAESLLYLQEKAAPIAASNPGRLVHRWEKKTGVVLAEQQRQAVEAVLEHGVFVLTGGPGTGKTTVVRAMLDILEKLGLQILLGAPTGRAAKRLSEATGRGARTVHRLLEASGGDGEGSGFGRNQDEPLEADVVILDEMSMMDIVLMRHFLEAVPVGCRVILVGDADQLPAVGPGSVLKDILRSGVVPQVSLTEVFRQRDDSTIVMNAHAINAGRLPQCSLDDGSDFIFIEQQSPEWVEQHIVTLCRKILPARDYDVLEDVQVLSPMHRGVCGVERLNRLLQDSLNPAGEDVPELAHGSRVFRLGDKVMQNKNNYEKGVFNGDIGYITLLDTVHVRVQFGDEMEVEYETAELNQLQLAYCMTVHKSQGSEYPVVILPLVPGHHVMLQRTLLYTAVTRAKKLVILLGTKAALNTAVANDRTKKRYTLLAERLGRKL
ncbi:MAG: AAA family ATPase, partial [Selenomonadaceae bacterium]|nr:AAA family ATPase [Selenomonadaceae bacterium]